MSDTQKFEEAWSLVRELQKLERDNLPQPDFEAGYTELETYVLKIPTMPTPESLSECLAIVQSYKDRVTHMLIVANNTSSTCKRVYQRAYETYYLQVSGTVAQREFTARNQYGDQYALANKAEDYATACKNILDNLKSTQEIISRQITIMQLEVELGSISRGTTNTKNGEVPWE